MAETQRSLATLQSLLADNAVGAISPQDLRDMMESLRVGHGAIYITSTAATSFSDTTSFVQAAGTWTAVSGAYNWAMTTNAQLKYTGAAARVVVITGAASFITSNNSRRIHFRVAKNGTTIASSNTVRKTGTGGDVGAIAFQAVSTAVTNDYFTVRIRNQDWTSGGTCTLETCNLRALDFLS